MTQRAEPISGSIKTIEDALAYNDLERPYVVIPEHDGVYAIANGDGTDWRESVSADVVIREIRERRLLWRWMDGGAQRATEPYLRYAMAMGNWDGICVVCDHDWVNTCHGDCTCLACNATRQGLEESKEEQHEARCTGLPGSGTDQAPTPLPGDGQRRQTSALSSAAAPDYRRVQEG